MPKLRTHRGYKKRLKKTGTGKLKRKYCGTSHFMSKRTSKRKRKLGVARLVDSTDQTRVSRVVPYL